MPAAIRLVLALVALMWALEVVDLATGGRLDDLGIEPRERDGLPGVLLAPLLHVGFGHLVGNTIPFAVMGAAVALEGVRRLAAVLAVIVLVAGAGVWLLGPSGTEHLGASSLVFGLAAYLLARGIETRRVGDMAMALAVVLLFGGALLGGLVPQPGVSWQGHALGALGGLVAVRLLVADRVRRRTS